MNRGLILAILIAYSILLIIPAVSAAPEKVDFTISTDPPGAHVSITSDERGTKIGVTPVTFQVLPDTFTVRIKDSAGRNHVSTVNVGEDGEVFALDLEASSGEPAAPEKVDFTISTHPQGADVSITSERGTKNGVTPVTFQVFPDTFTVMITDSAGRAHVSTEHVGEDGTLLTLDLEASPGEPADDHKVDFTISTHPQGADVSITSERGTKNGVTPVTFQVLPDTFTVIIKDSAGRSHVTTVNVGEDGDLLTLDLEASSQPTHEPEGTFEEQIADVVFTETNAIRVAEGKAALRRNTDIDTIALAHSNYLAPLNTVNHDNSDSRFAQIGEMGFGWKGENVAQVRSGSVRTFCDQVSHDVANTPEGLAEFAVDMLANHDACQSFGHRNNILNSEFTDIGIGVAKGTDSYIITQDFGG
jgi:uncharacterized protein YkwD